MSAPDAYVGKPVPTYLKVLSLAVPLAVLGVLTVAVSIWKKGGAAWELWALTLASYCYVNKFVILWATVPSAHFGPWAIAGLVLFTDAATVLFMIANMDVLYGMPYVGRKIREMRRAGWEFLHVHKWLGRTAVLGLAAFVLLRIAGAGAVGGTRFGRLVGLDRPGTVAGVMVGSAAGCAFLAAGAAFARAYLKLSEHPGWLVVAGLVLAAAIFTLHRLVKRRAGNAPPPGEEAA